MSLKSMPLWKWVLMFVLSLVLAFFLMYIAQEAMNLSGMNKFHGVFNIAVSAGMLLLYAIAVKLLENKAVRDLKAERFWRDTLQGLGIGALFFVLVVGVMLILGYYKIAHMGMSKPQLLIDKFMLFLTVAVGEEIVFRGVLFRWMDERWGFLVALLVSAVLFGAMHFFQPNATVWSTVAIAIEAGILLGAAYKASGTLWLPIGIHWAWNFVQGNIFGFPVSGIPAEVSLIQAKVSGPVLMTGGNFGAEASVITVVLGAVLSILFIAKAWKKRR